MKNNDILNHFFTLYCADPEHKKYTDEDAARLASSFSVEAWLLSPKDTEHPERGSFATDLAAAVYKEKLEPSSNAAWNIFRDCQKMLQTFSKASTIDDLTKCIKHGVDLQDKYKRCRFGNEMAVAAFKEVCRLYLQRLEAMPPLFRDYFRTNPMP